MRPRFGYLHVPKAAGRAVTRALHEVAEDRVVCPAAMDRTLFGGFGGFDRIEPDVVAQVHLGAATELAAYDVVIGHFCLPTLLGVFAPEEIAVTLREPRARLLSLYTFWRGWRPDRHDTWSPYESSRRAAELEWPTFLAEPSIAAQTDNVVVRLLVGADPRIPADGFIAADDIGPLVAEAVDRLDGLGFVDVIDRGPVCWARLGSWLDAELTVTERNRTVDESGLTADWDRWLEAGHEALVARTAGDTEIWSRAAALHAAAGFGDRSAIERLADETHQRQVARVRELASGASSTTAHVRADQERMRWSDVARLEPIWLNLGGRENHHPAPGYEGYVAVDLVPPTHGWAVAHDLRDPIPLPDGSVQRIITEDFIEHLPADMLPPLLAECHRLLAPGGTMRIACPDYENPKDRYAFDRHPHDVRNPEHITRTDRAMLERLLFGSPFDEYRFVQYWDGDRFVEHPLDESLGPVRRCPANDPRCRRRGARARLRGLLADVAYVGTRRTGFRLGEFRSRPGKRWHVTSLVVDLAR